MSEKCNVSNCPNCRPDPVTCSLWCLRVLAVLLGAGVMAVIVAYAMGPGYQETVRADQAHNATLRSEMATVVASGRDLGQVTYTNTGYPIAIRAELRYVDFGGKLQTSHVYWMPPGDQTGDREPVVVQQDGTLYVQNEIFTAYSDPYWHNARGTEVGGWLEGLFGGALVFLAVYGLVNLRSWRRHQRRRRECYQSRRRRRRGQVTEPSFVTGTGSE